METNYTNTESFDESQSIQVIREMIQVSQNKIKNGGILFIIWGWVMFYNFASSYLFRHFLIKFRVQKALEYFGTGIGILALVFSIYYILKKRKRATTYIDISLRYVWISLIICLSLINMMIFNVINEFNDELQHPIFMVLTAFAIVVTGGVLRYNLITIGGVIFGILAYVSSYFNIETQILFEAIAWLIAFVMPGHLMYATRKK